MITLFIKLLLYWPSAKSYRSMARMKQLAPRMKSLQERHGSDRQALSKATMELYRKEKVNPMGGCLPMLVQIPIFIALYWVLIESVQLRQAPFIFWIHDLSLRDPFYILPIIMGASMLLQQKLSPPPPDPTPPHAPTERAARCAPATNVQRHSKTATCPRAPRAT